MTTKVLEYAKQGLPGVSKKIKQEGDGKKPMMGDLLSVTYSVFLEDGRVLAEGNKKEIRLGKRELWGTGADLGLASMKAGERAVLTCEAEFAGPNDGHPTTTLDLRLVEIIGDGIGFSPAEIRFFTVCFVFVFTGVLLFLYKEGFFG